MDSTLIIIQCILQGVVDRIHIILEFLLLILSIWFLLKKKETRKKKNISLEEEEKIISDWLPEPFVTEPSIHSEGQERIVTSKVALRFVEQYNESMPAHVLLIKKWQDIVARKLCKFGKYVTLNQKSCLNLASLSFLGLSVHPDIEESATKTIKKYGVGSCGPRGFYGTVDVHLELEERLAKFMGVEEAVVYAFGFSTISSAIPAYSKRGDIIFVDNEVNFAIQKGLDASRSEIKFFKHNDMNDLERLLSEQHILDLKNKRKAARTRKFLIVEGIYMKTGEICPLPKLIDLCKKYHLRIFIDESVSFGTLGQCGRGVTEHFNIPIIDVDLIMASMECAISSVGGFCVGSSFIVEHQRLSGLGYCFSASLPPLLTSAAISALYIIENNPQIVSELQDLCSKFHDSLTESTILRRHFSISGDKLSPIKHLCAENESLLKQFVNMCEEKNTAVTQAAYLKAEKKYVIPSIRLSISRLLTEKDIQNTIEVFEKISTEIAS